MSKDFMQGHRDHRGENENQRLIIILERFLELEENQQKQQNQFLILGEKLMAALDDANANLAVLAQNTGLIVTALQTGGGGQTGGATEAQVQALADGVKTINNTLAPLVQGGQVIPDSTQAQAKKS